MKFAAAALLGLCIASGASAKTLSFSATLAPTSEVPPTTSPASGTATATLNTRTRELTYEIDFQGFTNEVTMAHFHGPAAVGVNAGVQVALGEKPVSPIKGSAKLTKTQEKQLEDGLWYVNVHSTAFPKGAIRGQVMLAK